MVGRVVGQKREEHKLKVETILQEKTTYPSELLPFLSNLNTWSQNRITLCHLLFMVCLIRSFANTSNIQNYL